MNKIVRLVSGFVLAAVTIAFAVGQSAVPTLIFPPGARATGLGEAFVAIADDATTVYYNPAGMGLAPLANSWQSFKKDLKGTFGAMAAKEKLTFAAKPVVWVSTQKALIRFDGKEWFGYESYLMEQNDNIRKVVKAFVNDEDRLEQSIEAVKRYNGFSDSTDESEIIELKLPFNVGVNGTITSMKMDRQDRLWVGTKSGLRRYDGKSWKSYTTLEGMVGNKVQCLALSSDDVWVGTQQGLSSLHNADWTNYTAENNQLPSNNVSAVRVSYNTTWVGTDKGLVRIKGEEIETFTTADGMVQDEVIDIAVDGENIVWIAHPSGITSFTGTKWKKFKFKDNKVTCLQVDEKDLVWVGTDKGVLRYYRGKRETDKAGKQVFQNAEWKHFHSKNSLEGNNVLAIAIQERDIWVLTNKAINRFDKADRQVTFSHEQLLPEFHFPDLYHDFLGITWPTEEWGTLGLFVNFISFGAIDQYDPLGRFIQQFYSWEIVGSVCYGTQVRKDLSLGINAKVVYSPLAPGIFTGNQKEEGVGKTFAVDVAMLKRNLVVPKLSAGAHLQNMGPPIFYIDKAQSDPIPLNIKAGLGYKLFDTPIHQMTLLIDANRELVKTNENGLPDPWYKALFSSLNDEPWGRELEQVMLNGGVEYWYSNFISGRIGTLYDPDGSRRELTFGVGVLYGNLQIDWSYISEPFEEASPARKGQMRFSILFKF